MAPRRTGHPQEPPELCAWVMGLSGDVPGVLPGCCHPEGSEGLPALPSCWGRGRTGLCHGSAAARLGLLCQAWGELRRGTAAIPALRPSASPVTITVVQLGQK